MSSLISLKIEALQNQLELLKSEIEKSEKPDKKSAGGMKKLKGILKGKGNFSEDDINSARIIHGHYEEP